MDSSAGSDSEPVVTRPVPAALHRWGMVKSLVGSKSARLPRTVMRPARSVPPTMTRTTALPLVKAMKTFAVAPGVEDEPGGTKSSLVTDEAESEQRARPLALETEATPGSSVHVDDSAPSATCAQSSGSVVSGTAAPSIGYGSGDAAPDTSVDFRTVLSRYTTGAGVSFRDSSKYAPTGKRLEFSRKYSTKDPNHV